MLMNVLHQLDAEQFHYRVGGNQWQRDGQCMACRLPVPDLPAQRMVVIVQRRDRGVADPTNDLDGVACLVEAVSCAGAIAADSSQCGGRQSPLRAVFSAVLRPAMSLPCRSHSMSIHSRAGGSDRTDCARRILRRPSGRPAWPQNLGRGKVSIPYRLPAHPLLPA